MAFRARTVENIAAGKLGAGEIIEIDGVTFGPHTRTYGGKLDKDGQPKLVDMKGRPFGAPTAAQLADDRLYIETLSGLPWPSSAVDRHGKGKCGNGMANALLGAISPFGVWPDERERRAQGNRNFKLADPVAHAETALSQRPFRAHEHEVVMAKAKAAAAGMDPERFSTDGLDMESLAAARGDTKSQGQQRRAG